MSFIIYEERAYGHDLDILTISHQFVCFVSLEKWEQREMMCLFKTRLSYINIMAPKKFQNHTILLAESDKLGLTVFIVGHEP